ncbi:c-type cytochrome biogenesis protein CcmI [Peteryoungia ipomoeae]|uniref:C-type cytochrome biogenesis protein CcmI n=1 Tax=Peteryoungia ipomoeae TaxID=1210932 RepID=A0A4S8P6C2_9HYPH|nr:c-type cytochrome biogenesis protein CcmI [Peteryoungia ipomoeae]THV25800.1 c-type cytochrome biogenesis protein CcmI [Peteryoungia ipomoeae]
MLFWIIAALLTVLVALFLLSPLLRARAQASGYEEGEAAVYRDQLRELERDRTAGLIAAEDADYARAEIARRLLSTDAGAKGASFAEKGSTGKRLMAQAFILICLPTIGLAGYLASGNPGMPDAPLAARLENPGDNVELLVSQVERHLAANPEDGNGWNVVAPVYFRMGRLEDAELAYRNAIRILGPDADRMTGFGETLVTRNDGIVVEDARRAFEAALKIEPNNPRADYYLALSLEQSGRRTEALAAFEAIAKASPPNAPWMDLINRHIATNSAGLPLAGGQAAEAVPGSSAAPLGNPTADDVANAQAMSAGDRNEMIRGMVASLDAKLKEDPNNFEGWMRLVRSYAMLKEEDRAEGALKDGLKAFPAETAEGRQLIAMAAELGLEVEETTP